MSDTWFIVLGFAGQGLFTARILVQWIASERAGRTVVPRVYWYLSLGGACLVISYAVSRHNPVYVLSLVPGAFIAMRNLLLNRAASRRELAPWAMVLAGVLVWSSIANPRLGTPFWVAVGITGSLIWAGRHLVQWWVSERRGVSTLPAAFWALSLAGGVLLSSYAIAGRHWVMVLGYSFGCIPYVRNLMLLRRERRRSAAPAA